MKIRPAKTKNRKEKMSKVIEWMGLDGFNENKCKPALKMAVQRIHIAINKKTNQLKANKREIAKLLQDEKEEKARIRVEHVIREDFNIEAYEIIELICEVLCERMRLIKSEKECPPDLHEGICTLIWANKRCEIPELEMVSKQFLKKYGEEFYELATKNSGGCVNERVVHKLSVQPPSAFLVQNYLQEIATAHNIDWTPTELDLPEEALSLNSMPGPTGFSVPMAPGTGFSTVYNQRQQQPPQPVTQPPQPFIPQIVTPVVNTQPSGRDNRALKHRREDNVPDNIIPNYPSQPPIAQGIPTTSTIGHSVNAMPLDYGQPTNGTKVDECPPPYEIPQAPTTEIPHAPSTAPNPYVNYNDNNDDDDNNNNGNVSMPPPAPGSTNDDMSRTSNLDDLAARFSKLQK